MIYRKAEKSDLPQILGLLSGDELGSKREIISDEPAQCYVDAFDEIQTDPNTTLFVAIKEDNPEEIVGYFQITLIRFISHQGIKRAYIENVRVKNGFQGCGIGTGMMRFAISFCKDNGVSKIELMSTKSRADSHRFYKKLGFEATHEGFKLDI